MRFDKHKVYPTPVLRPYSNDYKESEFQCTVDFKLEKENIILVKIRYDISCNELAQIISEGKAKYITSISCRNTYVEHVLSTDENEMEEIFDTGEFRGEVRVDPFVLAVEDVKGFSCGDINDEFGPGPFDFVAGQILAQEESQVLYIDRDMFKPISSLFDLVKKDGQHDGTYTIGFDNDHVQIEVSPKTKELIDSARNNTENRIILINSVYFSAVTESINKLKDEDSLASYGERKWAQVILSKAHNMGIDIHSHDSYYVAEKLMEFPLARLNHYVFGKNA